MKMRFDLMEEILRIAMATQGHTKGGGTIPLWISYPGMGKTQIVASFAEAIDYLLFTVIIGRIPGVDVGGMFIPCHDTKTLIRYTTGALLGKVPGAEKYKGVLIHFDEIGNGTDEQWTAIQSLLEDRQIEGDKVPDNVLFVASTNPPDSNCGSSPIIQSLMDRLCPIDLEIDHKAWCDWAIDAGVDPRVIGFNLYKEGRALQDFDPEAKGAQPSPRGWVKFSDALACDPSDNAKRQIGNGYVGPVKCAEFLEFEKIANELPTNKEIIQNPKSATVPKEVNALYATVSNLIGFVRGSKEKLKIHHTDAIITYFDRLPEVFAVLGFTLAIQSNEKFCDSDEFGKFQKKHRGIQY